MCAAVQPRWQVQPVSTPADCLLPYARNDKVQRKGITFTIWQQSLDKSEKRVHHTACCDISKYHHASLVLSFWVPLSRQVPLESLQTSNHVFRSTCLIHFYRLQLLFIRITTYSLFYMPVHTKCSATSIHISVINSNLGVPCGLPHANPLFFL